MKNILKEIYDLTNTKKQIEEQLKRLWDEVTSKGITSLGSYEVDVKEIEVRNIVAAKFREAFGQDVFNAVAKVTFTDAVREVPEPKIVEAGCIETTTRTSRKVVCTRRTSTGSV